MTIKEMFAKVGDAPFLVLPFHSSYGAKRGEEELNADGWRCYLVDPKDGESVNVNS